MDSIAATTSIDNKQMNERGCSPVEVYLQQQAAGQVWTMGGVCQPLPPLTEQSSERGNYHGAWCPSTLKSSGSYT